MYKKILCTLIIIGILTMMVYANVDSIEDSLIQESDIAIEFKNIDGVEVFDRGIYVNGEKINNYHSLYSFVLHDGIVYFPVTYGNGKIFGLNVKWDEENSELVIENGKIEQQDYQEQWMKHDLNYIDMTTYMYKMSIDGKRYQSNEYPALAYNCIAYLPLTYEIITDYLGWDMYFDMDLGIYISTNPEVSAESMVNLKAKEYYKALADYTMIINKNLDENQAMNIVMTIKEKCELYHMDELLIFSTIWQESNFDPNTYYKGAIGLMQIMEKTGASAGLTPSMLYDPETNIGFGISYLSDKMNRYDDNAVLALSAYNQGTTRVDKGIYNTRYYNDVMGKKAKTEQYLLGKGLLGALEVGESIAQ